MANFLACTGTWTRWSGENWTCPGGTSPDSPPSIPLQTIIGLHHADLVPGVVTFCASNSVLCEGTYSYPVAGGTTQDYIDDVVAYCAVDETNLAECLTLGYPDPDAGASLLPDLTLEEGGLIATAIILLWTSAFAFRVIKRQIEES